MLKLVEVRRPSNVSREGSGGTLRDGIDQQDGSLERGSLLEFAIFRRLLLDRETKWNCYDRLAKT